MILVCRGCGATKAAPSGDPTDMFPAEHCGKCPPWVCDTCGELSSATALCSCWISVESLPFADLRGLFAASGFDTRLQVGDE